MPAATTSKRPDLTPGISAPHSIAFGVRDLAAEFLEYRLQRIDIGPGEDAVFVHVGVRLEIVECDVQPVAPGFVHEARGVRGRQPSCHRCRDAQRQEIMFPRYCHRSYSFQFGV